MTARFFRCAAGSVVLGLLTGTIQAAEVKLPYKGLTLNANLELAAGRKLTDGVVLITHGALAHNRMEAIAYLQNLLKEKGYNTLAINLSLGLDHRRGMYDCQITHRHRNEDAAEEIGAWVGWLHKQGARRLALLGHSRGGAQTALYLADNARAPVQAAVLLAPATRENSDAAGYQKRFNQPLTPLLDKAQKLIQDGNGGTVLKQVGLMTCADTPVTAESFVSYYGPRARVDTVALIGKSKLPTLVVVASNDEVVVGLDKKVAPVVDGKRVQMRVIDGADHLFRDLYADDAVEAVAAFLKGTGF